MTSYSSHCWRWRSSWVMLLAMLPYLASSFHSMHMSYKPPVQSSVSKMRSNRLSNPANKAGSQQPASRQSSKQHAAAASLPTQGSPASFEDRMRGLVFGGRSPQASRQKTRILPPNVCSVETLQEYKRVVGDEASKLVCVRFYAPWCKACRAVQPLFYHMANKFPNVVFVDVPVTDKNVNLHQGLEVPSLPYCHIYHPTGGLVEELRLTKRCIPQTALKLQHYTKGRCDLEAVGDVTCPYGPTETSTDT